MSPAKRLQVVIPESMIAEVKARGSEGGISEGIRQSLSRYYQMLKDEREVLRGMFTAPEICLLADINNGTIYTHETIQCFDGNAIDAEPERYEYWGVDRKELLSKLSKLTISQLHALVDAIERYWEAAAVSTATEPAKLLEG